MDGINVHPMYLKGLKRRANSMLHIPDTRLMTTSQWEEWKSFIHHNFLSPGLRINPPLGDNIKLIMVPKILESDREKMLGVETNVKELKDIIELLPTSLKQAIGEI